MLVNWFSVYFEIIKSDFKLLSREQKVIVPLIEF